MQGNCRDREFRERELFFCGALMLGELYGWGNYTVGNYSVKYGSFLSLRNNILSYPGILLLHMRKAHCLALLNCMKTFKKGVIVETRMVTSHMIHTCTHLCSD